MAEFVERGAGHVLGSEYVTRFAIGPGTLPQISSIVAVVKAKGGRPELQMQCTWIALHSYPEQKLKNSSLY